MPPTPPSHPKSEHPATEKVPVDWLNLDSNPRQPRLTQASEEHGTHTLSPQQAPSPSMPAEESAAGTLASDTPPAARKVPKRVGPYNIVRPLARGGMGAVYLAFDSRLKRPVALKMILAGEHADADTYHRFRAEAEVVARLHHPHIVQIYEVGEENGLPYLALEYIDGGTLHQRLSHRPLPPRDAATLLLPLAEAVQYAHERNVIHRDLKPGNILLASKPQSTGSQSQIILQDKPLPQPDSNELFPPSDVGPAETEALGIEEFDPKITDFGLAKLTEGTITHTRTGDVLGTPNYMAPEQARGKSVVIGPPADVYALGAILYEMLVGRPPFQSTTPLEVLLLVQTNDPVPPTRFQPFLPRDLETICLKCLQKEPHKRYPTAQALAEDVRRYLDGQPILARPVGLLERLGKWAKRRPAVAALSTAMILTVISALLIFSWLWRRAEDRANAETKAKAQVEEQKGQAETARQEAETARQQEAKAHAEAEAALYFSRIALAFRAYDDNRIDAALNLLDACVPQPGRPDLRRWEWHYLKRLCRADLMTTQATGGWGWCITFSPDGKTLATATGIPDLLSQNMRVVPGSLSLWDAATGRRLGSLSGHGGTVIKAEFSPDGKHLASVSADGTARVWDLARRQQVGPAYPSHWKTPPHSAPTRMFGTPQFLQQGRVVRFHQDDGQSLDVDLTTGQTQPRSGWLIGQSQDGKRRLSWFNEHGKELCFEDETGQQRRYPAPLGLPPHSQMVLSPCGKWLVFADEYYATICEAATGKIHTRLAHPAVVLNLAVSPDGTQVATASGDGKVRLWEIANGGPLREWRGHGSPVRSVAFSPDGTRVASLDQNGVVKVWDVTRENPRVVGRLQNTERYRNFAALPDRPELVIEASARYLLYLDLLTGGTRQGTQYLDPLFVHPEFPSTTVAFSADSKLMAAPWQQNKQVVRVWDTTTGKEVCTLWGHRFQITCLAFSADGRRLATGCAVMGTKEGQPQPMGEVIVWDVATQKPLYRSGTDRPIHAVTLDGTGRQCACAGSIIFQGYFYFAPVTVVATDTGKLLHSFGKMADGLETQTLAFNPQGTRLAVGGVHTGQVWLWDTTTGTAVTKQPLQTGGNLTFVNFSPDGDRLTTIGYNAIIKLWDAQAGHEVLTLPPRALRPRPGDYAYTARAVFSPDGARLYALNYEGLLAEWDGTPLSQTQDQQRNLLRRRHVWHQEQQQKAMNKQDTFAAAFHRRWQFANLPLFFPLAR